MVVGIGSSSAYLRPPAAGDPCNKVARCSEGDPEVGGRSAQLFGARQKKIGALGAPSLTDRGKGLVDRDNLPGFHTIAQMLRRRVEKHRYSSLRVRRGVF
jgi:hypothetical protein